MVIAVLVFLGMPMLQAHDPSTMQLFLMSGIVIVGSAALGSVLLETGEADVITLPNAI